jgi:hypothetical protein
MLETTMVLVAERAADRRRNIVADPLLARAARLGRRARECMTAPRAAPVRGRRRDYQRAA